MRWFLLFAALAAGGCGTREPGETCSSSEACVGDGVCLKGVCAGYSCALDEDCGADQTCGSVAGVATCVQGCEADAECPGEQLCQAVSTGSDDDSETMNICF